MPPKPRAAETKRTRASGTAAATTATTDEDRSVRQRRESSSAAAAAPSAQAAPAAAVSSAAVTPARLSLMRLAVVERQLIMQALDLASLARLASTCKQLSAEALHREAGKFIPAPIPDSALDRQCWIDRDHPAHASSLFRMHVPVRVDFHYVDARMTLDQQQALMAKAARFSRITELNPGRRLWTEPEALHLLAQPWIQSVNSVSLDSRPSVWLRSAVQHALFALPQLTSVWLDLESDGEGCELNQSALSLASKLTDAQIYLHAGDARMLRALRTAPSLRTVELISTDDAPLGPWIWSLPPALAELRLSDLSLEPASTSRSALKTMFTRLPRLRRLCTLRVQVAPLLQGMLDAGVGALPDLRLVEFETGLTDGLSDDLLRRFLHKFPAPTVHFDFRDTDFDQDPDAARIARHFGAWPRVQVTPHPLRPPPTPHPSDDEAESDVELEAEPNAAVPL